MRSAIAASCELQRWWQPLSRSSRLALRSGDRYRSSVATLSNRSPQLGTSHAQQSRAGALRDAASRARLSLDARLSARTCRRRRLAAAPDPPGRRAETRGAIPSIESADGLPAILPCLRPVARPLVPAL